MKIKLRPRLQATKDRMNLSSGNHLLVLNTLSTVKLSKVFDLLYQRFKISLEELDLHALLVSHESLDPTDPESWETYWHSDHKDLTLGDIFKED